MTRQSLRCAPDALAADSASYQFIGNPFAVEPRSAALKIAAGPRMLRVIR